MRFLSRLGFRILSMAVAIPAYAGFGSADAYLPAVGRVAGQGDAQFYTTVWVTNLSSADTVHFTFRFLKSGQGNAGTVPSFDDTLAPGETKIYENVVEEKLGLAGELGAARITADGEVFAAERIYNQAHPADNLGTTEGLFFAAVPASFSIGLGETASIQGVNQGDPSEDMRYNFALVETAGQPATVHVRLLSGSGASLGAADYPMQPYEQLQPNVAQIFPGISTINARLEATVTAGAGKVLIAGAQLGNTSQDSSGFEMTFKDSLLGGGGSAGVTSVNGLSGALSLVAGTNITLTNVGSSSIRIDAAGGAGGGLASVSHDSTMAGNGTPGTPLGVAVPLSLTAALPGASVVTINNPSSGVSGGGIGLTATSAGSGLGVGGGSDSGFGVAGSSKTGVGVMGTGTQGGQLGNLPSGAGVVGIGTTVGVYGVAAAGGTGVSGKVDGSEPAVQGLNNGDGPGVEGDGNTGTGVYGSSGGLGSAGNGVYGIGTAGGGTGVHGIASVGPTAYGLWGESTSGFAGYFNGKVSVNGALSVTGAITAGVKDFKIDHPLDPENKYLVHASVESSEMTNMYSGNVVLGPDGGAVVHLPAWVEAANEDFRYQLTCIGGFAGVYVAHELEDGRFTIAGGIPGVKVSWQLTGIRRDAYAKAHPIVVEEEKTDLERGLYLHPEAFGQPEEKGIDSARRRAKALPSEALATK